ncbi:MAG: ABC transporter ATP-binding protein [Opitutaceae bacterium]|nr:ABC transporter ATP-binding protein [Cytophagales bacterium]
MAWVIKAENISKQYFLNNSSNLNLKEAIVSSFKELFSAKKIKEEKDGFWALKDLCFEINEGDKVGIIGSNGAGKSTLLKVLSRIVEPTSGRLELKGKISSLLEVGTGFHPELTGRENILLNGSILGMKRVDIVANTPKIIEFSEIADFIDTPVKHYSSGMYVRLAFAVAAHLDPEILVLDEVLAVGDASFQKKCFDKIQEINKSGKTIIYVSHDENSVKKLTNKVIYLQKGKLKFFGNSEEALALYENDK